VHNNFCLLNYLEVNNLEKKARCDDENERTGICTSLPEQHSIKKQEMNGFCLKRRMMITNNIYRIESIIECSM